MKKTISTIAIILVFIIGLLIVLYPTFSNWYNQRVNSYAVATYVEEVARISEEEYQALFDEAIAYNDSLSGTISDFYSGEAQNEEYINALNVNNGMIGYLIIDKIDVQLAIYHGTDEDVLQMGIGHLEGSQLPTGEIGNNTVLTGHTGLPSADLLTDLDDMEIGDTFQVYVLNQIFTYEVYAITVVEPTETELLMPVEDMDIVTLVTCTPYGINSHRLLVQGEQISVETADADTTEEVVVESDVNYLKEYFPYIVIAILLLLSMIAAIRAIVLRDNIRTTKVVDKIENKQDRVDRLSKKYLKDESKFIEKTMKPTKEERRIQRLEAKFMKNEAKYLKKEEKRIQKIEEFDRKLQLKERQKLDKIKKKHKDR